MDHRIERAGAYCGFVAMVLFFVAFMFIAKLIPPPSPTWSAEQVAQFFTHNKLRIRIGLTLSLVFVTLWVPFYATLVVRVRRAEGRWGPVAITQLIGSVLILVGFYQPMFIEGVAAFRPESRLPQITQAINDMMWLPFVAFEEAVIVASLPLALATFIDRNDRPTFPRWFGYFNLWFSLGLAAGLCVPIFNDGPLAWNGLFGFWLPAVLWGVWFIVTPVLIIRSVNADQAAETETGVTKAVVHSQ